MTEPAGRSARWGTLAVVAPLAAAALAAATGWGVAHPPAMSGTNASEAGLSAGQTGAAAQDTAGFDKSLHALQQQASTQQARVVRLQKMLNRLHAQTRALARAPLTGAIGSGSVSAGGTVSVAAPPRVTAAPAPATHASTGAS